MLPSWLAQNPRVRPGLKFGRAQQFVINPNGIAELCDMLKDCPKHAPTPLLALPALAERLGVGEIRVKDESQRFGFGAFKALGGVLAVYNALSSAVGNAYHIGTNFADVMNGLHGEVTAPFVFSTASSGNHGRAVAAGAKLFGNRCVIFLPKFTSAGSTATTTPPSPNAKESPARTAGRSSPTRRGRATTRHRASSCAATACWRTRRSPSKDGRRRRMSSSRPAWAGSPPR